MRRGSRGVVTALVAGAVVLGAAGLAAAQTATTTTTSAATTTSTTLLPHPLSPATRSCVHQARGAFRACRRGGASVATCAPAYQTAFANCFKPGTGVTCAKKCVTTETTCLGKEPTTEQKCRKTCRTNRTADLIACKRIADGDNIWAGGDASCFATAQATSDLCNFNCSEAALDCRIALRFCIANCANL